MTRLASAIEVTSKAISDYEKGHYPPVESVLLKLSETLRFPIEFFQGIDLPEPKADVASFRSMARMTSAQRDAALGAGALAFILNDWIDARFALPQSNLLDLRGEDPEVAADIMRQHWGLGERPIKNAVHLLEAHGVRVYSLQEQSVEVDAFSLWHASVPFVFLNTLKSSEHSRFDAAHELGHLVLHRHGGPHVANAEKDANSFASAFLMPRHSMLAVSPRPASVSHLIQLKKHWTVSVAALAYRLHGLGMLTDWHYRSLCIEISQRGYRKCEPDGAHPESSQILAKVFASLRQEGTGLGSIAKDLSIHLTDLNALVFGLVMLGLDGERVSELPAASSNSHLRVIK